MKKQALLKDTRREFKKSFSRFLSILLIVAVGTGFFVGIKATAPSMLDSAEDYFVRNDLMDFEILSSVGFSDEDMEELGKIEGIDKIEPAYSVDLVLPMGEDIFVTKAVSIPEDPENDINIPRLISGRLPEAPNECVMTSSTLNEMEFKIGQEITFSDMTAGTETNTIISELTYTIVGFVDMPQYISYTLGTSSIGNGFIFSVILIPEENFLYERYTEVYVSLDCHEKGISAYSEEYNLILEETAEKITELGDERYELFVVELEKEFEKNKAEAEDELSDAKEKLDEAAVQISDGLAELEQGWSDYEQGKIDAESQIRNSEYKIAETKKLLSESEAEYQKGLKEYTEGREKADSEFGKAQREINSGRNQYKDAQEQVEDGRRQYEAGLSQYRALDSELDSLRSRINSLDAQIEEEERKQSSASSELSQLQGELSAAEARRDSARAALDSLDPASETYESDKAAAEAELRSAESDISSISSRIDDLENFDNSAEIKRLENEKAAAEAELAAGEAELAALDAELDSGKAELEAAEEELEALEEELDAGQAKLDEERSTTYAELDKAKAELDKAKAELDKGYAELSKAEAQLASAKAQLQSELDTAYNELLESEKELDEAQSEYDKNKEEYDEAAKEAENEISSGMNRIQNLKQGIDDVETGKWYVFGRDEIMVNYESFRMDAERIDAIADVFPVFFLAVASLVCLTTMSRMVDEQRTQIGIYSALGYSGKDIVSKYAIYAAAASILGSVIGAAICVQIMPRVIFAAYTTLYHLPYFNISIPWNVFVISLAVALCCTVLVAFFCCWKELKNAISSLMRPKVPKAGKRIWMENLPGLWNKLSFSHKLTARNLFRYKIRLIMTVLGISGCMALIIAGFGLNNAIAPIVDLQFGEIVRYDAMISTDKSYAGNDAYLIQKDLEADERIDLAMPVYEITGKVAVEEKDEIFPDTILFLPREIDNFGELVNLRDPDSGEKLALDTSGVIITKKVADKMGLSVGDMFTFSLDTEEYELKISGITENYVYSYIYISPDYYREVFEKAPMYNKIYAVSNEKLVDEDAFTTEWLEKSEEIILIFFTSETKGMMTDTMNSLKLVVVVIILFAGALAFIVVYNLTNINISERIREIATIKVLGFKHREVNMYIFRENMVMCVMGILLGAVLGFFMAQYVISAVEVNMVTFSREVLPSSYLYGAGLTVLFTLLVNAYMTRRLKAIDMVDSLKAVE